MTSLVAFTAYALIQTAMGLGRADVNGLSAPFALIAIASGALSLAVAGFGVWTADSARPVSKSSLAP